MSKLQTYCRNFLSIAQIFPVSVMEFSKVASGESWYKYIYNNVKRQKIVEDACESLYKYHTIFGSNLHNITGTLVLQGTDKSINYLAEECGIFAAQLEFFNKKISSVKNVPELEKYYKDTFIQKHTDIFQLMLDEIESQSLRYNFSYDRQSIIDAYKTSVSYEKSRLQDLFKGN